MGRWWDGGIGLDWVGLRIFEVVGYEGYEGAEKKRGLGVVEDCGMVRVAGC